jgi:glutathione S-transferase
MTLKVLGRATSINVRKVLWTCAELDLHFEHVESDAALLARNPNAMVPVIQDGEFVMWESNAICRYLASKQGRGTLLPHEPEARAMVEQWMDWQAAELNSAWRYSFSALVRKTPAHPDPHLHTSSPPASRAGTAACGCSTTTLRMAGNSSPGNSSRSRTSCWGCPFIDGC